MGKDARPATPVSELDVPFVSVSARSGTRRDRRDLADAGHWLGQNELGYFVIGYDETKAVLRDRRWHSGLHALAKSDDEEFERWRAERQPTVLALDGPDHQRLRKLLAPALTPNAVEWLRPVARTVIDDLLVDAVGPAGCELVAEVCAPYPIRVVFALLGGTAEMADEFSAFTRSIARSRQSQARDLPAVMAATAALDAFAESLLTRIGELGQPGLLTTLLAAERRGELSRPELVALTETVLLAGTESTAAQLACAVTQLARFPDEYQRLRAEPELTSTAAEEAMRYLGTVRGTARLASVDIDHRGVRFPAGTLLLLGLSAANRDAARFPDPDRFDVARVPDPPHLTLGHGSHFCAGAALARLELQEALSALARNVEEVEVTGEIEWAPQTIDFWGPTVLPVTLHPAR